MHKMEKLVILASVMRELEAFTMDMLSKSLVHYSIPINDDDIQKHIEFLKDNRYLVEEKPGLFVLEISPFKE